MARKTAMKKEPTMSVALPESEKRRVGMPTTPSDKPLPQRLSPGVYRGPRGQLQTASGRQLPRPTTQPTQASRLVDAMGQQQPGQIATRPPAPLGTPPGNGQQDGQGSAPVGDLMQRMPAMSQENFNQFMQQFQQQQSQAPDSITEILQQGGQQQPPMMQNPQMNFPTPQLTFEQWKQRQMSKQMQNGAQNPGQFMPAYRR